MQNKELEATEERKRKAKQLEMQRKEATRAGRSSMPRTPVYPTYTPPAQSSSGGGFDSYEAEKNKSFQKYVTRRFSDAVNVLTMSQVISCSQG